jgi:hypothetical protein
MQRITFRETPGRAVIYLLVLTLVGVSVGWVVGKATAAEPSARERVVITCATNDAGACRTPTRKAKRFNRKFHNNALGRDRDGFSPNRLFKKPRKARRVIVRKIDRMLDASRAAGREATATGNLRARGIYINMVRGDSENCSMFQSNRQFSGPMIPERCDGEVATQTPVGMRTLVEALGVTACAGTVAVAMLTPAGRVASGALKFWGVTFQMGSCTSMALLVGMD